MIPRSVPMRANVANPPVIYHDHLLDTNKSVNESHINQRQNLKSSQVIYWLNTNRRQSRTDEQQAKSQLRTTHLIRRLDLDKKLASVLALKELNDGMFSLLDPALNDRLLSLELALR
jgi:hypothetical protein